MAAVSDVADLLQALESNLQKLAAAKPWEYPQLAGASMAYALRVLRLIDGRIAALEAGDNVPATNVPNVPEDYSG
jgi:hypothetical protein